MKGGAAHALVVVRGIFKLVINLGGSEVQVEYGRRYRVVTAAGGSQARANELVSTVNGHGRLLKKMVAWAQVVQGNGTEAQIPSD